MSELTDFVVVRLENDEIQSVEFKSHARFGPVVIPDHKTFSIFRDDAGNLARIDFYNERGDHVFACSNETVLTIINGQQERHDFPKE